MMRSPIYRGPLKITLPVDQHFSNQSEPRSRCPKGYRSAFPYRPTAVLVLPPCCVIRGRHLIFTAPRVNESSEALLDQTWASPVPRQLILSEVSSQRATLAFWMCCSKSGEWNLCMMIRDDISIKETEPMAGPEKRP